MFRHQFLISVQLVFCLFLLATNGYAQERLHPFRDEQTGLYGFSNRKEKVIAQFDSIAPIYHNYPGIEQPSYIVGLKGKYGVFNCLGQQIISCEYDHIVPKYFKGNFVAMKGDKCGIINSENRIVLPFDYSLIHSSLIGYKIGIKDKIGFIDWELRGLVPIAYDSVNLIHVNMGSNDGGPYVIRTVQGDQQGIHNPQKGTSILLPLGTVAVEVQAIDYYCTESPLYYAVQDKKGKFGAVSENGDFVVPFAYSSIHFTDLNQDSCNFNQTIYAITFGKKRNKAECTIYNTRTGQQSLPYSSISPFNSLFFFWNESGWGVLDSNFRELVSGLEGEPSYLTDRAVTGDIHQRAYHWHTDLMGNGRFTQALKTPVFVTEKRVSGGKTKYGLVNTKTGKKIQSIYDDVALKAAPTANYYWCYIWSKKENRDWVIDTIEIRNEQLELLKILTPSNITGDGREFKYTIPEDDRNKYFAMAWGDNRIWLFLNALGEVLLIPDGETNIFESIERNIIPALPGTIDPLTLKYVPKN